MKKPKCSLSIKLRSGEKIEIFLTPKPKTIGFDSLDNIVSFYLTVSYKPLRKASEAR
jgi:hypothetical protein